MAASKSPGSVALEHIDWDWIAQQLPNEEIRFHTGVIDSVDAWWVRAISKVRKEAQSSITASLLRTNIRRQKQDWYETISVKARQVGVPFETFFVRLVSGDEGFSEAPDPESQLQGYAAALERAGYTVQPPKR